jgi:hypothetical protein
MEFVERARFDFVDADSADLLSPDGEAVRVMELTTESAGHHWLELPRSIYSNFGEFGRLEWATTLVTRMTEGIPILVSDSAYAPDNFYFLYNQLWIVSAEEEQYGAELDAGPIEEKLQLNASSSMPDFDPWIAATRTVDVALCLNAWPLLADHERENQMVNAVVAGLRRHIESGDLLPSVAARLFEAEEEHAPFAAGATLTDTRTAPKRKAIPQDVKIFVWRRDQGRCVNCGDNRNLEYDHIIPFSKGGSNTERNIQLLCERCNRSKGARIGI